jgi:hypothetical protein
MKMGREKEKWRKWKVSGLQVDVEEENCELPEKCQVSNMVDETDMCLENEGVM